MLKKSRQLAKEGLVQEGLDLARESETLILANSSVDSTILVSAKIQVARMMMQNKEDAGSYIADLYEYVIENPENHSTVFGNVCRLYISWHLNISDYEKNASDWRMARLMWSNGLRILKSVLGQDHPYVLKQQAQLQKWWVQEILGDR